LAGALDLSNARDRDDAIAAAIKQFGKDGSRLLSGPDDGEPVVLAPSDMAMLADPENLEEWLESIPAQLSHGVEVSPTTASPTALVWEPSTSAHSRAQSRSYTVPPTRSSTGCSRYNIAALIPHTELRMVDDLGHLSASTEAAPSFTWHRPSA
jgi:hypothetical protein